MCLTLKAGFWMKRNGYWKVDYGVQERNKLGELQLFILGMQQKGSVLRLHLISYKQQRGSCMLFSR